MNGLLKRRQFVGHSVAAFAAVVVITHSLPLAATEVAEHNIEITNFIFSVDKLTVKVGDKITWVNKDIVPHTATAKDRSWDTGLIKPGDSSTIEVTSNMTASYFCEYHPMMVAELSLVN